MDNMETKDLNAEELEKVKDAELDDVSGGNDGSYGGGGMYCPFCNESHSNIRHKFTVVQGNYAVYFCSRRQRHFYLDGGAYYDYETKRYIRDNPYD